MVLFLFERKFAFQYIENYYKIEDIEKALKSVCLSIE